MENPATTIPPSSSLFGSVNSWFTSFVFFVLLNLMIATILFTSNLPNNNPQQNQQEDEDDHKPKQIPRSPSMLHRLKSFNFLPKQPETEDDNQHEQEPELHVAATQYVFNQPLHYQHFDFESEHTEKVDSRFEFDPTRDNMGEVGKDESFDFDPTRDENGGERFGFDPTREVDEYERFDIEPTRNENEYERFEFDPTREEKGGDTGFDFDPTHEDDEFQSLDEVYSRLKGGGGHHHDRTKSDSAIRPKPTTKFKKSSSLKLGYSHLDEENTVEARRPATVRERKPANKAAAAEHDDDVEVDSRADDFINKFKNDLKLQRIESIMKSKNGKK